jgi:MFS family permease
VVELSSAGAIVSLTSWLFIPALPLGAWMAERAGRPFATLVLIFIAIAVLILMIPFTTFYTAMFILLGIVFAPAGGLIMALPARVLRKENRAVGMGIFFTIYFAGMGVSPVIAGYALDLTGNPFAPLVLAGMVILLAIVALVWFGSNQDGQTASPAVS